MCVRVTSNDRYHFFCKHQYFTVLLESEFEAELKAEIIEEKRKRQTE